MELPGSSLLSNELCYYLYPKRVGCITRNEMQSITEHDDQVPQGLNLSHLHANSTIHWNLRKVLHYKCRANESSPGKLHPLKPDNGIQREMQYMTCYLHIFRQKCHSNMSNAMMLIKQGLNKLIKKILKTHVNMDHKAPSHSSISAP